MKMKRIAALLLAVIMCTAVFAACGGGGGSTPTPDPTKDPASGSDIADGTPRPASDSDVDSGGSDKDYIMGNGKMIIGITIYEPMNYYDDNGDLTGFDTEFARAVCEKLGVEPEFLEINWDSKEIELSAKSIDCIWNGMTITDERAANMSISLPYVKNAQVVVVREDSGITSTDELIGKTVVAEIGSAGEAQIKGDDADENLAKAAYIGMAKQTDCLMEVKAGTADAAVLDWTLAMSSVGAGTQYEDLVMVDGLELAAEEYGIAFRKGSDMTAEINAVIEELVADGTLGALAEKYGLALAPSIDK